MEKSQKLEIEKKFSQYHIYLFVFILVYVLERYAADSTRFTLMPIYIMIPFLILDISLSYFKFFKSIKVVLVLRYLQLSVASYLFVKEDYIYTLAIILICMVLFFFEYVILYDLFEGYFYYIGVISAIIPILLSIVYNSMIFMKVKDIMFPLLFSIAIISFVLNMMTNVLTNLLKEIMDKLFAQTRLITNVNETNEALRINQEKVKKANELLAYQKIKLEAAYNKINSVNSEVMIQNQIIKYISSSLELGKLMTLITESIINEMGVDICAIMINSGEVNNQEVSYKIKTRYSVDYVNQIKKSIEDGVFYDFVKSEKPYIDNRIGETEYPFINKNSIGSLIIVPLIQNEERIGALFVGHPQYDFFTENTAFFEAIVSQFLIAINNANLYSKMESMAIHDALTGIYNRGHLSLLLNQYLNESIINKTPLSVALLDIDKFKNINDTYGHLFGDTVLKIISDLAREVASVSDGIVGRYGGEEFVIAFPNKGLEDSYVFVEMLHDKIRQKTFIHNGKTIHVNVSIGITSYPTTCKNPCDLLSRADWAMYYSKQNGRGIITIDSDEIRESVRIT